MSIRKYLENIKQGKAINYEQFISNLPDKFRSRANNLFETKLISAKPKRWAVSCDSRVFDELWEISEPAIDRVHAAQLGDSHSCGVTANLVMVYHQALSDKIPSVVYVSQEQIIQTFKSQPRLLLIENEENFIRYHEFCQTVSKFMNNSVDKSNTDIALGGGNRVTSDVLMNWYVDYGEILCAFDYDLGGLRMFKTLQRQLGDRVKFVQPSEYSDMMKLFKKKPESDEKLMKSIGLAKELGFEQLASAMFETRCFMEQEILLNGV